MEAAQVLSYRLLPFEREFDGRFKPPASYPRLAVATAGTHDLPTLTGWSLGRDIEARRAAGLLPEATARDAHAARRHDVTLLLEALASYGAFSLEEARAVFGAVERGEPDAQAFAPLAIATYRYLARTPACLVFVQLDDAVVSFDQVNLPGTVLEYPNWRRKMAIEVEALAAHPTVCAIAAELRAERTQGHTN
jgi:4-alpha-glucanotransferase